MIPTKIYTVTLTANGSFRLQVPGKFFKILTASGSVKVDAGFGSLTPIGAGNGLQKTPFDYLYFTDVSGGANTLTVVIGDENFLDNSVGSVTIVSNKAPQSSGFTSAQATVTNASGNLIAANPNRQYFMVQNNDPAGFVYVNLSGAAATVLNSFKIPPGGFLEVGVCVPTGLITAIGSIASNANVVIIEG